MGSRTLVANIITLSADMDRVNVTSLAREAHELVASGVDALRLDGSAVVRARLCSVQMLASAAHTALGAGIPFCIENPSDELVAAIELTGMSSMLLGTGQETA